jgi:hypothetical protein
VLALLGKLDKLGAGTAATEAKQMAAVTA